MCFNHLSQMDINREEEAEEKKKAILKLFGHSVFWSALGSGSESE